MIELSFSGDVAVREYCYRIESPCCGACRKELFLCVVDSPVFADDLMGFNVFIYVIYLHNPVVLEKI
ncbi:MAG: hypothetical protein RRY35_05390, partial [Clostridiales bacterium]